MNGHKLSTMHTVRYFWRKSKRYPAFLIGMFVSLPVASLMARFLPALITAGILDRLSRHDYAENDMWGSFGPDLMLVIGMSAFGGIVVHRIVGYCNWKLEGYVVRDIAKEVFNHMMRLSASFHSNSFAGSLVSQTNKLTTAYVKVTDTTLYSVTNLLTSLTFTSIMLASRAPLFVLLLVLFAGTYIACAFLITRKVRVLAAKEAEASNKQTGYLADSMTNVLAVKSFAAGKSESLRYGESAENTRLTLMEFMRVSLTRDLVFSTTGSLINAAALLTAVAGIVIFNADIATAFLILTYTSIIILQLWDFSTNALRNYNRAFGDAESMMEILNTEPDIKDPKKPIKPHIKDGAITFKDMNFTHPESNQAHTLFENLNLSIKPNEKIGLVGHSGSGKTSLTYLLLRFIDVNSGEILIDNQNIAHMTQDNLRRHIAYVPQEPLLFHRTIKENISFGKQEASAKEIVDAAKKAHADEFISKLPKGYDTLVGERGVKLSGGQRQRIAIARAILKDAPILVLDEATSALDSESEKLIQDALWELMKDRTAIVIAHRLSTIQKMDRIIVLDNGKMIEQGSHNDLLKQNGTYAKLWAHQSGGFLED